MFNIIMNTVPKEEEDMIEIAVQNFIYIKK